MSKGRFEVRAVDNGFELSASFPDDDMEGTYQEPKRGVATTEAQVKEFFDKWLSGDDKNFKFDKVENG